MKFRLIPIIALITAAHFTAQQTPDGNTSDGNAVYAQSQRATYKLKNIVIDGTQKFSAQQILRFTGLYKGQSIEVPGQQIGYAIKKLWETDNFSEVDVYIDQVEGEEVTLRFYLKGLKELGEVKFVGKGIGKSKNKEMIKENRLSPGTKITKNLIASLKNKIPQQYKKKGFYDAKIDIKETPNPKNPDIVNWEIAVSKGKKAKVDRIAFEGNKDISDRKLRKKAFKNTKQKRFNPIGGVLKPSKFIQSKYNEDKKSLVEYYNALGYRDARVLKDDVTRNKEQNFDIKVELTEGKKYYIGNISFTGNTAFSADYLEKILGYKKGDIYDAVGFNKKVGEDGGEENDSDIKSIYMNNGYLFSQVTPVEKAVNGNVVDLEIRINEGEKAKWNKVTWSGNTTTHDHVILRALRTKPGDFFTKRAIKRTYFDLGGMQFFDPQQIKYDIKPHPEDNTVDVHWTLAEKGSSQVQLQAGYGGNSFIGTLGLTFNNFSLRNFLKFKDFKPIPQGDGQTLSLTAQAGQYFQNYGFSFVEPWLFGTKPTALSLSVNQSLVRYTDSSGDAQKLNIFSASAGLNRRLSWPDDYFSLYTGIQYQSYKFRNYPFQFGEETEYNGSAKNFSFNVGLSRNSAGIDPIFPKTGSNIELSAKFTPPYSLFQNKDYSEMTEIEKYKWMEFFKIKFKAETYNEIIGKLVLRSTAEMGFMDGYDKELGAPPFERFYVGGTGLFGGRYDGRELIPLRGYENASSYGGTSTDVTALGGGTIYNRFSLELRYPISMSQTAKIYALSFIEGGNVWNKWSNYNPFQLKRSAGVGIRIYMGAFGLLGFDFAYGFDSPLYTNEPSGWKTHFLMNQSL